MKRTAWVLIFFGLGLTLFWVYQNNQYKESAIAMNAEEVEDVRRAREALPEILQTEPEEDTLYYFNLGEKVGELLFPTLSMKYEVFFGTDEHVLKQGVGMYDSDVTSTPDKKRHTFLAGHRDTVFSKLGELKMGEEIIVRFEEKLYFYKITDQWIADENDRSIITAKDKGILTLSTCYPFEYLASATERYIIEAELVSISLD